MNEITKALLEQISDWKGGYEGAYNIREDGGCAARKSTDNIRIESKKDEPGLDIFIEPGTKGESVSIPACVTHGNVDDLTYNDFHIGENADVLIVAGCGVHTEAVRGILTGGRDFYQQVWRKWSRNGYHEEHRGDDGRRHRSR